MHTAGFLIHCFSRHALLLLSSVSALSPSLSRTYGTSYTVSPFRVLGKHNAFSQCTRDITMPVASTSLFAFAMRNVAWVVRGFVSTFVSRSDTRSPLASSTWTLPFYLNNSIFNVESIFREYWQSCYFFSEQIARLDRFRWISFWISCLFFFFLEKQNIYRWRNRCWIDQSLFWIRLFIWNII